MGTATGLAVVLVFGHHELRGVPAALSLAQLASEVYEPFLFGGGMRVFLLVLLLTTRHPQKRPILQLTGFHEIRELHISLNSLPEFMDFKL